mgnify:CR=1 FL=1
MDFTRALVTGASSGIGRAMALQLADAGTALVVVARDEQRLNELAAEVDVECEVLGADLADPVAVERVAERLAATDDAIDLLVNNAGFGVTGKVGDQPVGSQQGMIDVNVSALVHLSHAAAIAMADRSKGQILNVSSVAGWLVAPTSATYAASKAFVTSFSQSLHEELQGSGVGVACLCPGLTRTEFQDRAEFDTSQLPDLLWQSAEAVATAGLKAAARNRAIEIPGALNKGTIGATQLMPRSLVRKLGSLLGD